MIGIDQDIKDQTLVCILNGGLGTRIREFTNGELPKGLVKIGDKEIALHIIDHYINHGFHNIDLLLGYQHKLFDRLYPILRELPYVNCNIQLIDTGETTETAGRLIKIQHDIEDFKYLMVTYGDGISTVNISDLLFHHTFLDRIGTITAVKRSENFGILKIKDLKVLSFNEKPETKEWINGGFMVFTVEPFIKMLEHYTWNKHTYDGNPDNIFDISLEKEILPYMAYTNYLTAFLHEGYWHCMDTYKDYLELNEDYKAGKFHD